MEYENLVKLREIIAKAATEAGFKVLVAEHGGYSHGPFEVVEVEFGDGARAYMEIGESDDDEYLYNRYEED